MKDLFTNQTKLSIDQRFRARRKILKPLADLPEKPIIIHTVHDLKTFNKILKDGKLKLPKKHKTGKKTYYMEKLLGIDNSIFYGIGFGYSVGYGWKYSLIFDLKYLKELTYFDSPIDPSATPE